MLLLHVLRGLLMLVSSIVGFNFGTIQASSQNIQKSQNKQTDHKNENHSCKTNVHKNSANLKQQHNKISLLA